MKTEETALTSDAEVNGTTQLCICNFIVRWLSILMNFPGNSAHKLVASFSSSIPSSPGAVKCVKNFKTSPSCCDCCSCSIYFFAHSNYSGTETAAAILRPAYGIIFCVYFASTIYARPCRRHTAFIWTGGVN